MSQTDDDRPIPEGLARVFPSVAMGEVAWAVWGLGCECDTCQRARDSSDPPAAHGPVRALVTPVGGSPDYPCGHPRTAENSVRYGKYSGCRMCNYASRRVRRAAAKTVPASPTEG